MDFSEKGNKKENNFNQGKIMKIKIIKNFSKFFISYKRKKQ